MSECGSRVRRARSPTVIVRNKSTETRVPTCMDALLLAATMVEETRDRAAARARVAQLPFVAAPLGGYSGPAVAVTAAAVPPSIPPRSGTRTPLQSPSPCPPPRTLAAKAAQAAQLAILREAYDETYPHNPNWRMGAFPNKKRVRELADRSGRTERQVRIFFQNERQRRKQKAERGEARCS